jgi:hypothetical protein
MKFLWKNPKTIRTQKVLRVFTVISLFLVLVAFITFSFSYPYIQMDCSYETGLCPLRDTPALHIAQISFRASYWAWGILAPLALLSWFIDLGISVTRQFRNR